MVDRRKSDEKLKEQKLFFDEYGKIKHVTNQMY